MQFGLYITLSFLANKDWLAYDDDFFYYYPLDNNIQETPPLQDPRDSNDVPRIVSVEENDSVYWIGNGPSNQAFCVLDTDKAIYTIPTTDIEQEKKFALYIWLKHYCENGSEALILHSRWFAIKCHPGGIEIAPRRISVSFTVDLDCQYNFPVSNGVWYYLEVRRDANDDVGINVNGLELEDVVKVCGLPLEPKGDFKIGSNVCVDEIYGTKKILGDTYQTFFTKITNKGFAEDDIGKLK